jgi:hypothetical protein
MSDPYAIALSGNRANARRHARQEPAGRNRGQPCYYRRKEISRVEKFTHRGSKQEIDLSAKRQAAFAASTKKRLAKGIRPPLVPYHVDPRQDFDARDTLGYVIGVDEEGEHLYLDLQLIGDEALSVAAANGVSLATVADAVDSDGERHEETIHHVAFTPDPALSNLGPYLKIAASAGGGPAREAPILILSAANRSTPMFKPETLTALRKRLKLADDAPESDVAERAAALALADPPADKAAEVTALSAKVQALETERDAAKAEALRLSASAPRQPDDLTVTMYGPCLPISAACRACTPATSSRPVRWSAAFPRATTCPRASSSTARFPATSAPRPTSVLRAGLLLGKVTTGGKYRESIIGVTNGAISAGAATTVTVAAAVATEVARLLVVRRQHQPAHLRPAVRGRHERGDDDPRHGRLGHHADHHVHHAAGVRGQVAHPADGRLAASADAHRKPGRHRRDRDGRDDERRSDARPLARRRGRVFESGHRRQHRHHRAGRLAPGVGQAAAQRRRHGTRGRWTFSDEVP